MGVSKRMKKNGAWVYRARRVVNGKPLTAYRKTKAEAEEEDHKFALMQKGELEIPQEPKAQEEDGATEKVVPTVREFEERWLEFQSTENGPAEMSHKRQILRDHVLDVFGDTPLDKITTEMIDKYKAAKLVTLAPATVANHVSLVKRMLHQAEVWGMIKCPKIKQLRLRDVEFDYLDFEEAERFIAASEDWEPFMLVAIRTGLRLGELRGLQWGDVDLDNCRIRVARAFTQEGWGPPKSGAGRTIDLSQDARDMLEDLKPRGASRTALVFPGPSGKPLDEKVVYKACMRTATKAGLTQWVVRADKKKDAAVIAGPFATRLEADLAKKGKRRGVVVPTRPLGPHKLRHTYASHHAMRGTPLPYIQAWMGHADIKTTMRYSHLCQSEAARYANNVVPMKGPTLVPPRPESKRREMGSKMRRVG